MRPHRARVLRVALAAAIMLACAASRPARAESLGKSESPTGYWPSAICATCHDRAFAQHQESHHERSFTSPLFQAQYFEQLLPAASRDPALAAEARACTACHAPVAFAYSKSSAASATVTDPSLTGVTCDLCHTIRGYEGRAPQNGNFLSSPGEVKLGPLERPAGWHRGYSSLHAKSELCAICHEAVNQRGLRVKATFTEWKRSSFARAGLQCQHCHMSKDGLLVDGGRYESGKAAQLAFVSLPSQDRLHSHRFPGVHSGAPSEGVVSVSIEAPRRPARAGEVSKLRISVDNRKTGHAFPTGSAELRLLWLEVTATVGGKTFPVPATSKAAGGYGRAGDGEEDARWLRADVPAGSRLYREVLLDGRRRQTFAPWEAVSIAWDNRLRAGEVRDETYAVTFPRDTAGKARVDVRLVYAAYPTTIADALEVARAKPTQVSSASTELEVLPATGPAPEPEAAASTLTPQQHLDLKKAERKLGAQ
jgi:hypothetical protein